jgi:uncharacterized protein
VQFLVLGVDGPEFGGERETGLHEQHWAYMDEWADALVARGPTLTPNGQHHTGSLHVVDVPDLAAATRFALEEPYAQAGWYAQVTVHPLAPCTSGTMWDKPLPPAGQPSSFVRGTFGARPRGADLLPVGAAPPWLYLGLVLSDDARAEIGLAGLVDLAPDAAARRMNDDATASDLSLDYLSARRWQRGGRHQS